MAPDALTNRLPWLGLATARLPDGRPLRMICEGRGGKCYIARRVAGQRVDSYEPETMRVFLSLLRPGSVFLDVGANTGLFALTAAALHDTAQVHAFEPLPLIARRLRRNVRLNKLSRIVVNRAAVGRLAGETELHVPATGFCLPSSASMAAGLFGKTRAIRVPLVSLDSYARSRDLPRVDVIKIDTETTEHRVIDGACMLLGRDQPALIVEVLPGSAAAGPLEEWLAPGPYQAYHIGGQGLVRVTKLCGDPLKRCNNYLFITPKHLASIEHLVRNGTREAMAPAA
jgi:FkbM family methyltransferase